MTSPTAAADRAARAFLRAESRALRGQVFRPVLLGLAATSAGIAGAWLLALLLAALIAGQGGGWDALAGAAALALLGALLGL
ncbi:MAG TPA: hypothetical protein VE684_19280, partial [Crenalkalicoccus sp.]|nr:hypothetical protein [Crenalkalicoccus sp.]